MAFPFYTEVRPYKNILECAAVLGIQNIYGYHCNKRHVALSDKHVVTVQYYNYLAELK